MKTVPLSPFGTAIHDLDVRAITAEEGVELRALLARNLLLYFPEQSLSEPDQIAFSQVFGLIGFSYENGRNLYFVTDQGFVSSPELTNTNAIKNSTGELAWHHDHSFLEFPNPIQTLYAADADPACVPTDFANHVLAYATLPTDLRERVANLSAEHEMVRTRATHPVVGSSHSGTGEPILYVNQMHTKRILDLPPDEADELLADLFKVIYREEHIYSHPWATGDLVIWDNISLSHHRHPLNGAKRTLYGSEIGNPDSVKCVAEFGKWFYHRAATSRLRMTARSSG